jgi:hypothetical protein
LLHVLPKGLVRIRHYGFLANRCKGRALRQCRPLCGLPPEPPRPQPKTVVQWLSHLYGRDHTLSPVWGGTLATYPACPPDHPPRATESSRISPGPHEVCSRALRFAQSRLL